MKVAYIGCRGQQRHAVGLPTDEYQELLSFLRQKNLTIEPVVWNDPAVDWGSFDVAILKSPWDYHDHIVAFYGWLDRIGAAGVRLLNPIETVKWNSNKHYLSSIATAGLPVIPSYYLQRATALPADDALFDRIQADRLVIKPCVSAGAKNTFVVTPANIGAQSEHINRLLSAEDFLVQPFVKEITNGEWSFLFFNGQYSHCVLKAPKQGDFRVQHDHGGTVTSPEAHPDHVLQAQQYVQRFGQGTLYARVDGVIKDGSLLLMELEIIEPYLFLDTETRRFENYYQALADLLGLR